MTAKRRIMSSGLGSRRTFKIVSVSKYPEKATLMVKQLAETLGDRYVVIHAANCERVEEVNFRVRDLEPDMLVWSSSCTTAEVDTIRAVTMKLKSDVELCALPEDSPSEKSVDTILLRLRKILLAPTV